MTPLLLAAATGQGDLVEVLVDAGADAGAENNNGQGIIFFLEKSSQHKTVKLLLQKGRTKAGNKLMMTTVRKARKNFCKLRRPNFAKLYRQMGIYNVTYPRDSVFQPRPHLGFQPIPLSFWPFRLHEILHEILTFLTPPHNGV